ncbi:MAG: hypothetical protein U0703_06895 [Anaerolineae bacterium]
MRKPVIISLILLLLGASLPAQAQDWTPVTPVTPGGDAVCARGTPYTFFVRSGDPAKLVIFFEGGGACWNDATCAPGSGLFDEVVEGGEAGRIVRASLGRGESRKSAGGRHTIVFVAYCTGDYHLGTQKITRPGRCSTRAISTRPPRSIGRSPITRA